MLLAAGVLVFGPCAPVLVREADQESCLTPNGLHRSEAQSSIFDCECFLSYDAVHERLGVLALGLPGHALAATAS
jgi:hypothetical protein